MSIVLLCSSHNGIFKCSFLTFGGDQTIKCYFKCDFNVIVLCITISDNKFISKKPIVFKNIYVYIRNFTM